MATYEKYVSYMDALCKGCENNCGGACAYDLDDEAEQRGIKLEKIRRVGADSYCAFFDREE